VLVVAWAVGLASALMPGVSPGPAHACTGGFLPFEQEARRAAAIAVVEVLSTGGPENSQPVLPPSYTPQQPPGPRYTGPIPDLEGVGARLRVESAIAGWLAAEIDVDAASRKNLEQQIRRVESNLPMVSNCQPGIGIQRYAAGERYLLFFQQPTGGPSSGALYSGLRYLLDGDQALIATGSGDNAGRYPLWVTADVKNAYFSQFPTIDRPWSERREEAYLIAANSMPVATLVAAIQGLRAGGPPPGVPGAVSPPDTGDAGIR
jgi:hypothetical protein